MNWSGQANLQSKAVVTLIRLVMRISNWRDFAGHVAGLRSHAGSRRCMKSLGKGFTYNGWGDT